MEADVYSCGDPELTPSERRGCGHVIRVLIDQTPHARECPLCGARRWHYLGRERTGLAVTMPGVQAGE